LWRKWKRSSFDSVAENIRTGTETRPNEIVPLQIGRATRALIPLQTAQKRGFRNRGPGKGSSL